MDVININSVYLMFLESENSLIPVSGSAFKVADGKGLLWVSHQLNKCYQNAYLISKEGYCHTIQKIDLLGFWGETWSQKFLSVITGTYKIKVTFQEPRQINLDEFKKTVSKFIKTDQEKNEPYFATSIPLDRIFENIKNANSVSEIFIHINFPDIQDCLDVL